MSICSFCHGGCCRRYNINLTGYDILKISQALGIEYTDFILINPVNKDEEEKISANAALFKIKGYDDSKHYRFCLNLVNSKLMPNSQKCMFLQEWNGNDILSQKDKILARCGIYGIRPLACAIFPAAFDKDALKGLTGDPNKFFDELDNPAYKLCPKEVVEDDFADYSGEIIHKIVLYNYEMDFFKKLAHKWNKNPGTLGSVFSYMKESYKNRIKFVIPKNS